MVKIPTLNIEIKIQHYRITTHGNIILVRIDYKCQMNIFTLTSSGLGKIYVHGVSSAIRINLYRHSTQMIQNTCNGEKRKYDFLSNILHFPYFKGKIQINGILLEWKYYASN